MILASKNVMMISLAKLLVLPSSVFLLVIPITLSAVTHLWNPIGFPAIYMDEDIYLARTLHLLNGLGPQMGSLYDHPYFGWLFLGSILKLINYPHSFVSSIGEDSIQMLYFVPRVVAGVLAVIDTFLIYKISELRYNKTVAFIASILFGVMPMTWITRWILLDTIQLPFLLSSILFALYSKRSANIIYFQNRQTKNLLILFSGIFMGLSIFTKVPAFTIIALVAYLIFAERENRTLKTVIKWIMPVMLIPLIWPLFALSAGQFDIWLHGVAYQTHRGSVDGARPLFDWLGWYPDQNSLEILFRIDPVLMILGLSGLIFGIIRKDLLLILWIIPFLIFSHFIGYVSFFHLITIFPAFCISIARLFACLLDRFKNKKLPLAMVYCAISVLGIFGLASVLMLIVTNVNSTHVDSAVFIGKHLPTQPLHDGELTIVRGETRFFWIFSEVFHNYQFYPSYWDAGNLTKMKKTVFIIENLYDWWRNSRSSFKSTKELNDLCSSMKTVIKFGDAASPYDYKKYPYTSMIPYLGLGAVEIRANSESMPLFKDSFLAVQAEPCDKIRAYKYGVNYYDTVQYRIYCRIMSLEKDCHLF